MSVWFGCHSNNLFVLYCTSYSYRQIDIHSNVSQLGRLETSYTDFAEDVKYVPKMTFVMSDLLPPTVNTRLPWVYFCPGVSAVTNQPGMWLARPQNCYHPHDILKPDELSCGDVSVRGSRPCISPVRNRNITFFCLASSACALITVLDPSVPCEVCVCVCVLSIVDTLEIVNKLRDEH